MPLPETLSSVATVADAIRRCASSIASYAYQRHCRRAYSRCPIAAEILAAPDVERHIAENADELATEVMGMDAGKTSDPMTLALIDTAICIPAFPSGKWRFNSDLRAFAFLLCLRRSDLQGMESGVALSATESRQLPRQSVLRG